MKIKINVGDYIIYNEDKEPVKTYPNRALCAYYGEGGIEVDTIPWKGTGYKPYDFKYEDGQFILDPIKANGILGGRDV